MAKLLLIKEQTWLKHSKCNNKYCNCTDKIEKRYKKNNMTLNVALPRLLMTFLRL